jgi:alpha-glucosidase
VTVARRKGEEWYVGAICADQARTAQLSLSFLGTGEYRAELYRDGNGRTDQVREEMNVTRDTTLSIALKASGGAALRIVPR